MSDYFTVSGDPATGSALSSAVLRAEYAAIAAGFVKVAPYSSNANKAVVINSGGTAQTVTTGTLALAGNFATTGAFNTTLIQGATTSLTLPLVSGTLATLAGTEEFDNKTLDSSVGKGTWTASGTWTLPAVTLGGAITYGGVTLTNAVTGTGSMVLSTSPVLTAPSLGTPTALVGTNITGTAAGLTAGTVTTNANLTGHITSVGNAAVLGSFTSLQLLTALTDETGTGAAVFAASPTLSGTVGGALTWSGAQTLISASPQLTLGVLNSVSGGILMYGSTSGSLTLKPAAAAGAGVTITLPATSVTLNAAGDLTGTTLAAGVTASSLTSLGTIAALVAGTGVFTGAITASTAVNALTTAAESWIGPSSTTGVYFKSGNVGIGTTDPSENKLIINSGATASPSSGTIPPGLLIYGVTDGAGSVVFKRSSGSQGIAAISGGNIAADNGGWNADLRFYTNNTASTNAFTERMRIDAAGNVGIGTTGPLSKLSINGGLHVGGDSDAGDNNALIDGTLAVTGAITGASYSGGAISGTTGTFTGNASIKATLKSWDTSYGVMQLGPQGSIFGDATNTHTNANAYFDSVDGRWEFIGTGYASNNYQAAGVFAWRASTASGSADGAITWQTNMGLDAAGVLTVNNLASGTLTSASGVITSSSDERLKDIVGSLDYGLNEVLQLNPIRYHWNKASGISTEPEYGGFGARQVEGSMPLAISYGKDGMRGLNDRVILGAMVNSFKEVDKRLAAIEAKLH